MLLHRAGVKPAIMADFGTAEAARFAALGVRLAPKRGQATEMVARDAEGRGYYAVLFEESPQLFRYASVHTWPEEWQMPDRDIVSVHPLAPLWLVGLFHEGIPERFVHYERRDVPLAEAMALAAQMGSADFLGAGGTA